MNWFQILSLVIQELPALETAAAETVQLITAISHAASQSPGANGVQAAAAALTKK